MAPLFKLLKTSCWLEVGIGWLGWLVQPQHQPAKSALSNRLMVSSLQKARELEGGELSKIDFFMKRVVISIAAKGKEIGKAVNEIGNRYLNKAYVFV